ncbi:Uncharacterised protein [uncultured archaeon]|nr:Uncharacterised protein [uncultured archaeon]
MNLRNIKSVKPDFGLATPVMMVNKDMHLNKRMHRYYGNSMILGR